jgi:hypothetical protein
LRLSRRGFIQSISATASVFTLEQLLSGAADTQFVNVAKEAGLRIKTIFGAESNNRYLLETTGCGVAFYDYDHDGWLDIFFVNGTRFEANWTKDDAPVSRLFKNNRDGTFTDVTVKAGVARTGWGQGCCVGDYDNDGLDDLLVTYWGDCVLYHNNGDGTFTDVSEKTGIAKTTRKTPAGLNRWNTGCAFLDYDRDGWLDLFIGNYIDFDPKTVAKPEDGHCLYKNLKVACGPPGLDGGKNILLHNDGKGNFIDVSEKSGMWKTPGTYALGCLVADFNNDGPIFTSPTIPPPRRSIATIRTARSQTWRLRRAWPTQPTENRRRAWASPRRITMATGCWIFSKRISPAIRRACITTRAICFSKTRRLPRGWDATRDSWAGARCSWITTTIRGRIFC